MASVVGTTDNLPVGLNGIGAFLSSGPASVASHPIKSFTSLARLGEPERPGDGLVLEGEAFELLVLA